MRACEAQPRVNHGIAGYRGHSRGERRENPALVVGADAVSPLTAQELDMPVLERDGRTGLRRSRQGGAYGRWRAVTLGYTNSGLIEVSFVLS